VEKMVEVLLASFTKNFGTLQNYMLQQFFTIPPDVAIHPSSSPNTGMKKKQKEKEGRNENIRNVNNSSRKRVRKKGQGYKSNNKKRKKKR
jgi:hypothetical protein